MTTFLPFLGALGLGVAVFEILSAWQGRPRRWHRLDGARLENDLDEQRPSTWQALLIILLPRQFDPMQARRLVDVTDLLRRAGYPYDTPGQFYAAAVQTFSTYLFMGGVAAGLLAFAGMLPAAILVAALYIVMGLRRPYTKLKRLAAKRAEATRHNMLIGIAMFNALLASGMPFTEAFRGTASLGGPFCNLLGLLLARLGMESNVSDAIETTQKHLPDANDTEAVLFLADVKDAFVNNRELLPRTKALQLAVHRNVVESTEARAALVRQRSGLFGVLAILGLIISMLTPFLGVYF